MLTSFRFNTRTEEPSQTRSIDIPFMDEFHESEPLDVFAAFRRFGAAGGGGEVRIEKTLP
jgi:hypothetical protein